MDLANPKNRLSNEIGDPYLQSIYGAFNLARQAVPAGSVDFSRPATAQTSHGRRSCFFCRQCLFDFLAKASLGNLEAPQLPPRLAFCPRQINFIVCEVAAFSAGPAPPQSFSAQKTIYRDGSLPSRGHRLNNGSGPSGKVSCNKDLFVVG